MLAMISHLSKDVQFNLTPVPSILERAIVKYKKRYCRLVEPEVVKETGFYIAYFRYYGRASSCLSGTFTGHIKLLNPISWLCIVWCLFGKHDFS